jgi:hypothetical protein
MIEQSKSEYQQAQAVLDAAAEIGLNATAATTRKIYSDGSGVMTPKTKEVPNQRGLFPFNARREFRFLLVNPQRRSVCQLCQRFLSCESWPMT